MLQTLLLGGGFVLATNVLIFAGYFTMRWLAARGADEDTRELSGSVIFRVSALHGLILALVFAQQMSAYATVEDQAVIEANAITNVHDDIALYDPAIAGTVQAEVAEYVEVVLEREWAPKRGERLLADEAWAEWQDIYETVLNLEPQTPRQQDLRAFMLQDLREIARIRDLRAENHRDSLSRIFWFAAISGVMLVSLAYFCYAPTVYRLVLIGVFGTYTGLVMFLIYVFSDPFLPPGNVRPYALQEFRAELAELGG